MLDSMINAVLQQTYFNDGDLENSLADTVRRMTAIDADRPFELQETRDWPFTQRIGGFSHE